MLVTSDLQGVAWCTQAQMHMGRLMGKGGRNIMAICQHTNCSISVPDHNDRPAGEPVAILVYGEDQASVSEAVRLVAKCFEGP